MKHKRILITVLLVAMLNAQAQTAAAEDVFQARNAEVLKRIQANPWPSPEKDVVWKKNLALLLLFMNERVEAANQMIVDFSRADRAKMLSGGRNESLFRTYLLESTGKLLTKAARAAIEECAWDSLSNYNRDITRADADKPFWDFSSTENHYVNNRRQYLLALAVVRKSERYGPEFKLAGENIESHYQAWTAFWIKYFQARAGEGTDMEIAHPSSYGACTVGVYYDLYDLTDSPRLRDLAGKFLTLYWAEVAAEFEPRTAQRAAAATRNPDFTGNLIGWARDLLYIYGWHDHKSAEHFLGYVPLLTSSYRPPEILRAIARNPERGSYLATSRRALLIDDKGSPGGAIVFDKNDDGHFRRDVFYTPDYTLGTMTLDPSRKYHNVGDLAQTMGATFAADVKARIIVTSTGFYAKRAISGITGVAVSIIARDPNAQVGRGRFMSEGTRVFIRKGPLWDNRVEDPSGWFFTRADNAYAAIRMPGGYTATTRTYIWPNRKLKEVEEKDGHFLELKDMWAPIVLQMGRAVDYKSFEAFQTSVKAGKFDYDNGKLTYVSEAKDSYEYWAKGAQLPKINGATVNLNPAKTYDSPYLSMEHGSNKAVIKYPGYDDIVLNF